MLNATLVLIVLALALTIVNSAGKGPPLWVAVLLLALAALLSHPFTALR